MKMCLQLPTMELPLFTSITLLNEINSLAVEVTLQKNPPPNTPPGFALRLALRARPNRRGA